MFRVKVVFLSGARAVPPRGIKGRPMYRPHVTVGDSEYLGVQFDLPSEVQFDTDYLVEMHPLYGHVDYSALRDGALFRIMEGPKKVGEGTVLSHTETDQNRTIRIQH